MKSKNVCLHGLLTILGILFLNQQIQISHLKKLTQQDLDFIHQTILQNQSNLKNIENIEVAYDIAQDEIINMRTSTHQIEIIKNYITDVNNTQKSFSQKKAISFSPTVYTISTSNTINKTVNTIPLPSNIGNLEIPTELYCKPCIPTTELS